MRVLFGLLIFVSLAGCAGAKTKLCGDRVIMREGKLKLSKNEQVLVCGSNEGGEAWRDVPLPQAEYQIRVKLQNDGFLHPRFEREGDVLNVWQGPRDRVKDVKVKGGEGILDATKLRHVRGEALEPGELDEVKLWADSEMRSHGYGCPKIDVRAEAWNGTIFADVDSGKRMKVAGIEYTGLEGLDTEALARYQAIEPGDWHDAREMQLTSSRMLADGLFQSAYFTTTCRDDKIDYRLVTSVGKPRILTFGVGASTEEFPFTRIWFKNARLDDRASSFTATLYASPRTQSLEVRSEFYRVPWSRRSYFGPRFLLAREKERDYEVARTKVGADLGRNWDVWRTRLQGRVGPTWNYVDTVQGIGPTHLSFLSWEGSLLAMSHEYEASMRDQYTGWQSGFEYRGQREGIGSAVNVDRFEFNFKQLWNLGAYTPPLFVLATRLQAIGLDTKQLSELGENFETNRDALGKRLLPVDYRVFFGGDQNLRGFSRQVLNNGGVGYATALYLGFELRLIEELPYKLQPFLLFDSAQLGDRRMTLDKPLFVSEGLGVRWASPFGTLRGSAARGMIWGGDDSTKGYPQEWVYFFSFGQEF